tara:strand:+ start:350 stop:745 length:396 start_codon:yes stop_codon:yes gene_type:complete
MNTNFLPLKSFIKNDPKKFESVDILDGVALFNHYSDQYQSSFDLAVQIDGSFYRVGMYDELNNRIRLCGDLIGGVYMDQVNAWIDDIGSVHCLKARIAILRDLQFIHQLKKWMIEHNYTDRVINLDVRQSM